MIPRLSPTVGFDEILACCLPAPLSRVQEFENAFAQLMDQEEAVAFPYGRTGLVCLLEALGIRNKEVICPAWTCVVVPHAVVQSGNEPVFVDCARENYNMDLAAAEHETGPGTGAIIATSIFGQPVDLDALDRLRAAHPDIPVIQDCAHSFAARWNGRPVQKEGIAALFGLNVSKLITSIFGGMVTTDDRSLATELRKVRALRIASPSRLKAWKCRAYFPAAVGSLFPPVYGLVNALERSGFLDRFVKYYDETKICMPSDWLEGMTGVQGAVGLRQIKRYKQIIEARQRAAAFYTEHLKEISGITLPAWHEGATWSHYTIRVKSREELLRAALIQGIQLGRLIEYCIPDMATYKQRPGYRDCPEARLLAGEAVNLPVWGNNAMKVLNCIASVIIS